MKLLIAAASVRPILRSAIAAGHSVDAWDLFADWDSGQMCNHSTETRSGQSSRIHKLPTLQSLGEQELDGDAEAAILGGGFENFPEVVASIGESQNLFGANADALRRLQNDDETVHAIFDGSGCRVAGRHSRLPQTANREPWLAKPRRSAGGLKILRVADWGKINQVAMFGSGEIYFQPLIPGEAWSALFWSPLPIDSATFAKTGGECWLLGCTRQRVGDLRLTNSPFAWCGSIGPLPLPRDVASVLERLGTGLAEEFLLSRLFGVDFIINDQGVWPIDINPRIPASAELFEMQQRAIHQRETFNMVSAQLGKPPEPIIAHSHIVAGKAVVFNQTGRTTLIEANAFANILKEYDVDFDVSCERSAIGRTTISDIPNIGTQIGADEPVCTVRCIADSEEAADQMLLNVASRIQNYGR